MAIFLKDASHISKVTLEFFFSDSVFQLSLVVIIIIKKTFNLVLILEKTMSKKAYSFVQKKLILEGFVWTYSLFKQTRLYKKLIQEGFVWTFPLFKQTNLYNKKLIQEGFVWTFPLFKQTNLSNKKLIQEGFVWTFLCSNRSKKVWYGPILCSNRLVYTKNLSKKVFY
jgi:hypothetical protein